MENMTNLERRVRAQEINNMNEDDKGMHIFYTLEEVEDMIKVLHKKMDVKDPTIGQKIATLEDVIITLDRLVQRCDMSARFLNPPVLPGEPA